MHSRIFMRSGSQHHQSGASANTKARYRMSRDPRVSTIILKRDLLPRIAQHDRIVCSSSRLKFCNPCAPARTSTVSQIVRIGFRIRSANVRNRYSQAPLSRSIHSAISCDKTRNDHHILIAAGRDIDEHPSSLRISRLIPYTSRAQIVSMMTTLGPIRFLRDSLVIPSFESSG